MAARLTWIVPGSAPYIYVCTRVRIRKMALIPWEDYLRLLNMSPPGVALFISRSGYSREIQEFSRQFSGIDLLEAALTRNLARAYEGILAIAPGYLRTLTAAYLRKWDIVNLMSVLRGISHGVPAERVEQVLIPAGELPLRSLRQLLALGSTRHVLEQLTHWKLYPALCQECLLLGKKTPFSEIENRLYKEFYRELVRDIAPGIKGGGPFLDYIRHEIDITNIKNLFRIRRGGLRGDITRFMIPGGKIDPGEFVRIFGLESRDEFVKAFRETSFFPIYVQALGRLPRGGGYSEPAELAWERWHSRQAPVHEVETAISQVRIERMELLAKRYPFSVLPILVYLERKKFEVSNLRAIVRGKEYRVPDDRIRRYLVM